MHNVVVLDAGDAATKQNTDLNEGENRESHEVKALPKNAQEHTNEHANVEAVSEWGMLGRFWAEEVLISELAHQQTPSIEKLVDGFGIPPVQVVYSFLHLGYLGQGSQDVVHHHVVEGHVDVEGEWDEFKQQGNEGQVTLAGRFDKFYHQDIVHHEA
jgi:hypothetical protein